MNADPAKGNKEVLKIKGIPDRNIYEEYERMKKVLGETVHDPDNYERACRSMAEGLGI